MKLHSNKGMSFIEVMYSLLVLSSTIILLNQIASQSTKHLERSKRYYIISNLMEQKLTELEIDFQKEGPIVLKDTELENFEDYPDFSWSLKTAPASLFHDSSDDPEEIQSIKKELIAKISELVIEVQLTIHYTQLKKKADYTITTYFVNFKIINDSNFLLSIISSFQHLLGKE